jgi:hypothetical protein
MFFRDHIQLITRKSSLELFYFRDATGTKRNTCRLVELVSKVCLKRSLMLNDTQILWIFVQLCFGHYDRAGTTEIIFVLNFERYSPFF